MTNGRCQHRRVQTPPKYLEQIVVSRIAWIDAFTNQAFAGNPACVCLDDKRRSATWMQQMAREMGASETAFLQSEKQPYPLRWFAPLAEVDLCGHATLAAAHVIWEIGLENANVSIEFRTRSGSLHAKKNGDWVDLDLPTIQNFPVELHPDWVSVLGSKPTTVARAGSDYLVELDSERAVRELRPNFEILSRVGRGGLIVTSRADSSQWDFVLRYFDPQMGIEEDPVTGSAHCSLVPFWARRLNKSEFVAYQASDRGGTVRARLCLDRVIVSGRAVTVAIGELFA